MQPDGAGASGLADGEEEGGAGGSADLGAEPMQLGERAAAAAVVQPAVGVGAPPSVEGAAPADVEILDAGAGEVDQRGPMEAEPVEAEIPDVDAVAASGGFSWGAPPADGAAA